MHTTYKAGRIILQLSLIFSTVSLEAQNINVTNKKGPLNTSVNTNSGNFFLPQNCIYIPSKGFDINIAFYYNSYNFDQNLGFGKGWGMTYGIRYKNDTANGKTIIWGEGREDNYKAGSGSGYISPTGVFSTFTQYQPGKFLLQDPSGEKYYFDNNVHKKITRMEELNGNFINFNYTDSLLTSLSNNSGQSISFTYSSSGLLTTVTDAVALPSRTFTFAYDINGNLINTTDPLNGTTKYSYLINGPMKSLTDKNNNTVNIIYYNDFSVSELVGCNKRVSFSYDTTSATTVVTDHLSSGNQVTKYKYLHFGNLSWLSSLSGNCCGFNMKFEFDANGNKIKETDANGNVYSYTYDAKGNLLTVTDPLNRVSTYTYSPVFNKITSFTDPAGNVYTINYDSRGNLLQLIEPGNNIYAANYDAAGQLVSSSDPKGGIYTYTYDSYGNPLDETGPNGLHINYVHDARGNLLSRTDAKGNTYTAQFDILNRLKKITDPLNNYVQYNYDAEGNISSFVTKNNEARTASFDASNRRIKYLDEQGRATDITYDGMDNITSVKKPLVPPFRFSYDTRNRLSGITDPANNKFSFDYDAAGNVTSVTLPNSRKLNYNYDNGNRITSITDGIGTLGTYSYDAINNVTSFINGTGATTTAIYDNLGRVIKITDPLGYTNQFGYDKNDNIIIVTDRNGYQTNITYDSLNRPRTITDNNGGINTISYDATGNIIQAKDQNNNITNYGYDNLNRLTTITFPNSSFIQLDYDKKNNITAKHLANGTVISFQYDSANRVIQKTLPGGQVYSYGYDALGRVTTATNSSGTINLAYDELNRLVAETFDGRTTRYNYSISGHTKTSIYPDSTMIIRTFDNRNRLISVSKNNSVIASFQYNNADQVVSKTFANGITTNLQYDFANRLSSISTAGGSIQNSNFTYNKERSKASVTRVNNLSLSEEFSYDNGNRLIGYKRGVPAGATSVQNSYTYDAAGNRTAANLNGTAVNYTNNNLNQLTSISGGQNINYTYDNNGNLTYDGHFFKTYDGEGKLLKDSASPSNVLNYYYDAFNRRIMKQVNGVPLKYTFSGFSPIEERDGISNNLLNRTVFSDLLTPLINEQTSNRYYYHQNEANSVEAITNSSGNLAERYQYDAYGKPTIYDPSNNLIAASATGNRFGFTGQEYNNASGEYHFHFRDYSPETGRFDQRDPTGYDDGMNIYQYVHNDPANGIDLLGLNDCPDLKNLDQTRFQRLQSLINFYNSHFGNILNIATTTQKATATRVGSNEALGNNKYLKGANYASQIVNLSTSIDLLSRDANNISAEEFDIRFAEIAANSLYLGADVASEFTNAGSPAEAGVFAAQVFGKVDAFSQEVTGKSLSRHYAELDDAAQQKGRELAFKMPGNQKRYDFHEEYLRAVIKRHGTDKSKWTDEAREIYDLHMKAYEVGFRYSKNKNCPQNKDPQGTQKNPPKGPGTPGSTTIDQSSDPNEIVGPEGVPSKHWVSVKDRMPYTIFYENSKSASAPAKFVRITSPVEPKQDPASFQLGNFGFNTQTFMIPTGTSSYYQRLDCRDSIGLFVDLTAGYDQINNVVFWEFQSIDPLTLLPPAAPNVGFLLLQDSTKPLYGHAFVNFSMKPVKTAVTLDTIGARAKIVFDLNDTIPTNIAKNTIDAFPPVSHMNSNPAVVDTTTVRLSWHGTDDLNGVGVKYYSLYVSVNGGGYSLYKSPIYDTSINFKGLRDSTYCFFTTATDSVGNTEPLKLTCDLSVTIPPTGPLPLTWLYFNGVKKDKDVLLRWATGSEVNTKNFIVERSYNGSTFTAIGTVNAMGFSTVTTNYSFTDTGALSLPVNVLYYRLKQVDRDGKNSYSIVVTIRLDRNTTDPVITVYPNPFSQSITLKVIAGSSVDKTNSIDLYTIQGKLVYHKTIDRQGNVTAVLNDLPFLTSGVYLLKTSVNGNEYTFKILKQ